MDEGEPLDIALKIYDELLADPSMKKKYDFLSLAYYQISNIEKFQDRDSYMEALLRSTYYDYLFGYDLNFLMNEANLIKIKGFIPFVSGFLPAKLDELRNSNKTIEEIKNIFQAAIKEKGFKEDCLKSIIEVIAEEIEEEEEKAEKIEQKKYSYSDKVT